MNRPNGYVQGLGRGIPHQQRAELAGAALIFAAQARQ